MKSTLIIYLHFNITDPNMHLYHIQEGVGHGWLKRDFIRNTLCFELLKSYECADGILEFKIFLFD